MVCAISSVIWVAIYLAAPISDGVMLLPGAPLGFILYMMFSAMGPFMTELYPTEVRGFCYNCGRAIGALFPALVGRVFQRQARLSSAILVFSVLAYGLILLALMMLPKTRGRVVGAITPDDMGSLRPALAGMRDEPA